MSILKITKKSTFYLFMFFLAFIFLVPTIWMFVSSLKPVARIYSDLSSFNALLPPLDLPMSEWITPYKEVFARFNLFRGIKNSLIYGTILVTVNLLFNSMCAYALAKFNFPLKNLWLMMIILILIVPMETGIVPLFVIVNRIGLEGTILGLLAPTIGNVFNVFLFRQFFIEIPKELEEAALIDGSGRLKIYFRIILPLSKPIFATVAILTFIGSWNDYVWPLLMFTDMEKMPLQVILNVLNNTEPVHENQVMAALTIATIPIILIYALFQKHIVQGISHTGIK